MSGISGFKLSRIYAEGWNAAKKSPSNAQAALDAGRVADLNPYTHESEKARWNDGFRAALES